MKNKLIMIYEYLKINNNIANINNYLYKEILHDNYINETDDEKYEELYDLCFDLEEINNGYNYKECLLIVNDIKKLIKEIIDHS